MKKNLLFTIAMILFAFVVNANNVTVSNVSLTGQDVSAGLNNVANFTNVKFDVSWDNSWRVSGTGTPNNWDAVWVFVKYKEAGSGQSFQHAKLSVDPAHHIVGTNNGVGATITPSADGMGVFIYRSGDGSGSINWEDITLRWMYRQSPNAVHDTMNVTLQVFAIEMVYIPEGSFYLGDGNMSFSPSTYAFRVNNQAPILPKGYEAYLVQSEDPLTFINSSSTSLIDVYDPTFSNGYTLPANFPKGYAAFYCMKYEVSQKQYVDFFNTLNGSLTTQKSNRNIGNNITYRNDFYWNGTAGIDAILLNGTSGDRAQNYLGWHDACAYADWAGLRPMSEMEYEKASRGHANGIGAIYPVRHEYAWGNTIIKQISAALVNDGQNNEQLAASDTANCNFNTYTNVRGPARVGIFAAKNPASFKRRATGSSFYGVMELSGNLNEMVVSTTLIARSTCNTQSAFSRNIHGDGLLNTNGNCDIPTWSDNPAFYSEINSSIISYNRECYNSVTSYSYPAANIAKIRGGSWGSTSSFLRTSDRSSLPYAGYTTSVIGSYSTSSTDNVYVRSQNNGFRAVRTAP